MPEMDGDVYSDGEQMVCSTFIIQVFKAGGMFEDIEF